jgi:putative FmdB family regulatory protein
MKYRVPSTPPARKWDRAHVIPTSRLRHLCLGGVGGRGYHDEMPLYEYICEDCERSFERLSPMSDADMARCPFCGTDRTRRVLSVIGGLAGRGTAQAAGCACGGACSCN